MLSTQEGEIQHTAVIDGHCQESVSAIFKGMASVPHLCVHEGCVDNVSNKKRLVEERGVLKVSVSHFYRVIPP